MDAFVTCIYNGLANTSFGGRNMRDSRYRESLLSIANTGAKIFCFTGSNDFNKLTELFSEYKNVSIILKELSSLPIHQSIQTIKKKYPEKYSGIFWDARCVEIMWGKFLMINEIISSNPELTNVFWIDAGLSHSDTTAPKYFDPEKLKSYIHDSSRLYTEEFMYKLKKYIENNLLIVLQSSPHNRPINSKYNAKPYRNNDGAIGGLFGGPVDKMKIFCDSFLNKMHKLIEDEELCAEESIMSGVYADHSDICKAFKFQSWYHEGWGERYNPKLKTFSSLFDTILEEIRTDRMIFTTLAIGERHRAVSLRLIKSFLEYIKDDMKLVIHTDDVSYYSNLNSDRIIVSHFPEGQIGYVFNYGIKYKVIENVYKKYDPERILYIDADCYFTDVFFYNDFNDADIGLNVLSGKSVMVNELLKEKLYHIAKHQTEINIETFRECVLLFRIDDKQIFENFLDHWEKIYNCVIDNRLAHSGECIDIAIAAQRSDFPVVSMPTMKFLKMKRNIWTTVLGSEGLAIQ